MGAGWVLRWGFGELHLRGLASTPGGQSSHLCLPQAVSSNPYLGDGRGVASLRLLSVLHRDIHPLLGQRWATTIPLLLDYLDGEAPGGGRRLCPDPFCQLASGLASGDQGLVSWKTCPLLWFRKGTSRWVSPGSTWHVSTVLGFLCSPEDGAGLVGSAGGTWVGCSHPPLLPVTHSCLPGWACLPG